MRGFTQLSSLVLAVFCGVASCISAAHHSEDLRTGKPIEWRGTITRVSWDGAHVMFMVEVPDATGKITSWQVLGASPRWLSRRGIGQRSLKPGEAVQIVGFLDPSSRIVSPLYFQTEDGRRFYLGFTKDGSNPM
jgi:hypothetical protein